MHSEEQIRKIGSILNDVERPLKERFRALFTLKNLGGQVAIDCISQAFNDKSALLKHEVAYCLGQMGDPYAVPTLKSVLEDASREAIVRHEAAEALAAIADPAVLPLLKEYMNDPVEEVANTCEIAVRKLEWEQSAERMKEAKDLSTNPYASVDPAPPAVEKDTSVLRQRLLDESLPLFDRYRAMFALRNKGDKDCVLALAEGLKCSNALFRHEIAYVLGQIQSEDSVNQLVTCLRNVDENDMVRHECAEALGSIATEDISQELSKYLKPDQPDVLRESCVVALDFVEYNLGNEFQYADSLNVISTTDTAS